MCMNENYELSDKAKEFLRSFPVKQDPETELKKLKKINFNLAEAIRHLEIEKLDLTDKLKIQDEYLHMHTDSDNAVWTWDGLTDDLQSMSNDRAILITAYQLRALLKTI